MVGFTKDIEYALLCLATMERNRNQLFSAALLAHQHEISPSLVAKILQKLHKAGLVQSTSGVYGGYELAKNGSDIRLNDVASAIKDDFHIIDCTSKDGCERSGFCAIRPGMKKVQDTIANVLNNTSVADLAATSTSL
jgi:Rrf2 family protein